MAPGTRPALDRPVKAVNTAAMPSVFANGIEIFYERFGTPGDPTLLMVSGLGAQSVGYDDELCGAIASLGLDVVRYDNRDVGLSTHFGDADVGDVGTKLMQAMMGEPVLKIISDERTKPSAMPPRSSITSAITIW